MEKHRCKLCLKSFANGRALGGHMRSHMVNLYVPPKAEHQHQLHKEAESASSSSASDAEENGERDLLGYGLRENPKKSIRLVDPEFSFAADVGSVVLQDRESETESSKNPIRRRSKRIRKWGISEHHHYHHDHHHQCQAHQEIKKPKSGKTEPSSWADQEPVSSISDATTEEDVAYCLMMLSRDKWMRDDEADEEESEPEESKKWLEEDDQTDGSEELKQSKGWARGKYKCETCHKAFRSYQALGGHRASHKKSRGAAQNIIITTTHSPLEAERRNAGTSEQKTHECPVCYRVFSSGQALGGHKRSHVLGSAPALPPPPPPPPPKPPTKFGEPLIDLNLPAPIDEDDINQIELSAVSDAEFVDPIKH